MSRLNVQRETSTQRLDVGSTSKLDAAAALLWALAGGAGAAGRRTGSVRGGDGEDDELAPPTSDELLRRYFEDDALTDEVPRWELPFRRKAPPSTLRADVMDFVATHGNSTGKSNAPLTSRAVARIRGVAQRLREAQQRPRVIRVTQRLEIRAEHRLRLRREPLL